MTTKTLLLVDGSSYLYRAYHALPNLRGPGDFPTGAIHGLVAMLKRALQDVQPEHAACVFDAKGDDLPQRVVPRVQGAARADARRPGKQIEPIHEVVRCSAGRCSRCRASKPTTPSARWRAWLRRAATR